MPTNAAQDSWILDTFGIDPASFASAGQQSSAPVASGQSNGAASTGEAEEWARKRPSFGRAAKAWAGTIAATEKDLHKIREEIASTFEGDEEGQQLEKDFVQELDRCLHTLDMTLHDELVQLAESPGGTADDPAKAARRLIEGHISYLKTDQFMMAVDENPFGIKVVDRLTASLSAIKGVLE